MPEQTLRMTGMLDTALGGAEFRHGIHPRSTRMTPASLPIRQFPFAPMMIIPLRQHLGKPAVPVVREGQEVKRGQTIAEPDGFMSVAMHAPASGVIRKIGTGAQISGEMVPGVFLQPHPADTQEVDEGEPCELETATPEEIMLPFRVPALSVLAAPLFRPMSNCGCPMTSSVDTLIINGVECEPYLTTDHRVMLEQTDGYLYGYPLPGQGDRCGAHDHLASRRTRSMRSEHLRRSWRRDLPVDVDVLRVKYPAGCRENPDQGAAESRGALRRSAH